VIDRSSDTPLDRSRYYLPANYRAVLEASNIPIRQATAIADQVDAALQSERAEPEFVMPNAIWLAKFLHDTYERLAPQYGYTTREDTRTFDHESANGRLMAAVCEELRRTLGAATPNSTVACSRRVIATLILHVLVLVIAER